MKKGKMMMMTSKRRMMMMRNDNDEEKVMTYRLKGNGWLEHFPSRCQK